MAAKKEYYYITKCGSDGAKIEESIKISIELDLSNLDMNTMLGDMLVVKNLNTGVTKKILRRLDEYLFENSEEDKESKGKKKIVEIRPEGVNDEALGRIGTKYNIIYEDGSIKQRTFIKKQRPFIDGKNIKLITKEDYRDALAYITKLRIMGTKQEVRYEAKIKKGKDGKINKDRSVKWDYDDLGETKCVMYYYSTYFEEKFYYVVENIEDCRNQGVEMLGEVG